MSTLIDIVDDDEAVRTAMELLMRSYGWRARAYPSAQEYLEDLARTADAADCLLLDLNMPGMGGAELLERLAARNVATPVIVVSGEAGSPLAARARRAGARAVLNKPFREEELKNEIEALLAE